MQKKKIIQYNISDCEYTENRSESHCIKKNLQCTESRDNDFIYYAHANLQDNIKIFNDVENF